MSRLHLAAVLYGPKDLRLEARPLHPPPEGFAQVAIVSSGLCGSDHHYYHRGCNGDFVLKAPLVLGHEAGGVVTAVGFGVTHLKVGQRVAIEPGIPCASSSRCRFCVDGRYNLCSNMRFCSSAKTFPHLDGTLQGYLNHPADRLHPLPEMCSFDDAALAEPLSVVMHASRRVNLQKGQSVLVFGVGAIGFLACALAQSTGASVVCAVDINQMRLDFVKANGFASQTLCLPRQEKPASPEEALKRAAKNAINALAAFDVHQGFDVIFECSGAEPCIQMGIHCARPGGKVALVGMGTPNLHLSLGSAALREVDLVGVFRYHDTWPTALKLLASGALRGVESMITHRLPLNQAKTAFELMSRGVDSSGALVVKVVVESKISTASGPPIQAPLPVSAIASLSACRME